MSALKDFFSFKWLTGSTSQTNAPARQGQGQTDVSSGQDRQSRVPSARGESIFAGEASPNKGFPTLIWAFFYAVLISMVVVAVIGWRSDLFERGISIIAIIFALILAFMFGLTAIFGNYVMILVSWETSKTVLEIVKGGEVSPTKLKALGIGAMMNIGMVLLVCFLLTITYQTVFMQENRISLMFNQVATPAEIKANQAAYVGGGLLTTGSRHVVKKGDTLAEIAQKYRVDVNRLKQHNKITSNIIEVGQIINIP